MQKSKLIIIIVAAVLAAALVITGIVLALKSAFVGGTTGGNNSDLSNSSSVTEDNTSDSSDVNSTSGSGNASNSSSEGKKPSSGNAEIKVGTVSGKKGQTVRVPVTIKSNPGIMAMLLEFKYDKDVLKYKGYAEGNVLSDYEFAEKDGALTFLAVESKDVSDNGDLFYLEFEILKEKESTVEIIVGDDSISNYDEEFVKAKGTNGKVKIK